MTETLLEVRGLRTYFFTYAGVVRALEGVDLTISEGEIFGLVGETGCGKSVTALSILRLVPPPGRIMGGEILYKGEDLLKLSEREMRTRIRGREIAATFQDPATYLAPSHTVGVQLKDIIEAHLDSRELGGRDHIERRVVETLRRVQLPDPERVAAQYPHELSGGMRQRAMIGMGTSSRPSLFIADEATTFLDVTIGAQILRLFVQMNREEGTAMLIITHNLGIVGEICDRVAVMYAGQVAEVCTVDQLFDNPMHPYTAGLLQAVPRLDRDAARLTEIQGTIPNLIYPPGGCRFNPRCEKAGEGCGALAPKMAEVVPGHLVACHLFEGDQDE
ncbi:MAG: ABC transporter ATP-binding protein [Candidatus Bathyarchaeota archaeon]|nr:ABC transporter ATP-binding protein [Candidatus Bathyarchaeota archaeon]